MNKSVKTFIFFLIGHIFPNFLAFVFLPIYANILGPGTYGVIALLESLQNILSVLLIFGMSTSFYVFYNLENEDNHRQKIFSNSFFFGIAALGMLSTVTLFSSQISKLLLNDPSLFPFVAIYILSVFVDYTFGLINAFFRTHAKASIFAFNQIFLSTFQHALTLFFLVYLGRGIDAYVTIYAGVKIAVFVLVMCQIFYYNLTPRLKFLDASVLVSMLKFGAPLILTSLSTWVLLFSNRFFINHYDSLQDVGTFSLAFKFSLVLQLGFIYPFVMAWEPKAFSVFRDDPEMGYRRLKKDYEIYLPFLTFLLAIFLLFIEDIFNAGILSKDYSHIVLPLYILAMGVYLRGTGEFAGTVCRMNKSSVYSKWTLLATLCSSLILNTILIPRYGIIGAAISTLVSEAISQVIINIFAWVYFRPRTVLYTPQSIATVTSIAAVFLFQCLSYQTAPPYLRISICTFYLIMTLKPLLVYGDGKWKLREDLTG